MSAIVKFKGKMETLIENGLKKSNSKWFVLDFPIAKQQDAWECASLVKQLNHPAIITAKTELYMDRNPSIPSQFYVECLRA